LAVLCATCHVLAGAASGHRGTDLHPDALRQLLRPGSRRRCIRCGHGALTRSPTGITCARCSARWRPQFVPRV
jgi:hypothetical protein